MRVYDKPIIIERLSESGEWRDFKRLHAFVNKTKDSASSLTFEVRYTKSLREIFSYMEDFLILYRGDVFLIEDYDDFMETHMTVRFKASVLRLGKFTSSMTIIRSSITTDEEAFAVTTETALATVRCYREGRGGSLKWANYAAFAEATDLFQFRTVPGVEFSTDYIIECNGERFKPLHVESIKGRGLFIEFVARKVVSTDG